MAAEEDVPITVDIDRVAASLRADASDLGTFVEALAAKLELTVPGGVRIDRGRTRPLGPKRVRRVGLDAGGRRLELHVEDGGVRTYCSRLSGGIVLKREQVGMDDWLQAMAQALADQARLAESTRQALERLLNG